ncbi:MAG: ABC transporter permease [Actinomycetota bacterium]
MGRSTTDTARTATALDRLPGGGDGAPEPDGSKRRRRGRTRVVARGVGLPTWFWKAFSAPGLLWLVVLFLVPFYTVFAVALGGRDPIFLSPVPVYNPIAWNPTEFQSVASQIFGGGPLQVVLLRTFGYVAVAAALCLMIGYPVAYYISRHARRTKALLLVALIAPFWISYLMRMLAWVNLLEENGIVNRFLQQMGLIGQPINFLNGRPSTVILGLVYGYIPFFILPLYASLDRIGPSMLEASRDLGASPRRTFFRVTLPLSRQGILAAGVIILLPMFGDYYTNTLLSGNPKTNMFANLIDQQLHSRTGHARGASMVIILSALLLVFMGYYLWSTTRAAKEYEA